MAIYIDRFGLRSMPFPFVSLVDRSEWTEMKQLWLGALNSSIGMNCRTVTEHLHSRGGYWQHLTQFGAAALEQAQSEYLYWFKSPSLQQSSVNSCSTHVRTVTQLFQTSRDLCNCVNLSKHVCTCVFCAVGLDRSIPSTFHKHIMVYCHIRTIHAHTHTCTHTHTHTHTHTRTHACTHKRHMYIHTCVWMDTTHRWNIVYCTT